MQPVHPVPIRSLSLPLAVTIWCLQICRVEATQWKLLHYTAYTVQTLQFPIHRRLGPRSWERIETETSSGWTCFYRKRNPLVALPLWECAFISVWSSTCKRASHFILLCNDVFELELGRRRFLLHFLCVFFSLKINQHNPGLGRWNTLLSLGEGDEEKDNGERDYDARP